MVCVTGATGYVAGHIIMQLLDRGVRVRGTVRSLGAERRTAHLRTHERAAELLELFEADLTKEGSFDEAVRGCTGVMHVANVVQLTSKDPVKDIIEPSVNGLRTVLAAVEKEPRVKCFVLTSSYAAIEVGVPSEPRGPLPEEDSNTAASPTWKPYSFSKVETEREAKEFFAKHPDIRYASIHPPYIIGPQLNTDAIQSGSEFIKVVLSGQYPFVPPMWFPMVDVRDVAAAHVACLENPAARGRYLTCNGHGWLMDLANYAREKYPELPIPTRQLYVFMFKFFGLFDKRLDAGILKENTVEGLHVDASKIERELGFKYQYDMRQSMLDHSKSLLDAGLVPGADKYLKPENHSAEQSDEKK